MLLATLLAVAGLVALGMAATGWLGRLAALILIALVCGDALLRGGAPKLDYGILGASIGILLLGSGRGGLWAPEDALLLRRTGARSEPARHGQATA
jgi:hypothetical protein